MATLRYWCVLWGVLLAAGVASAQPAVSSVSMTPDFPLYDREVVPLEVSVAYAEGVEPPRALAVMLNPNVSVLVRAYPPLSAGQKDEGEDEGGAQDYFISPGRDSGGFFAISWINPPAASFSFRVYLVMDRAETDRLSIEHYTVARYGDGPVESPRETVSAIWQPGRHDADTQEPAWHISLQELLRAIQFYNSLALHCAPGTEDNYAPGPGDQSCRAYDLDYAPQDWRVSLSELLRLIQLYNMGGYFPFMGTEDEFVGIPDPTSIVADPPVIGPGQSTTLSVLMGYGMVPGEMTIVDYNDAPIGVAEFVSHDGLIYTYHFTSPGGYTGRVLLKTMTTGWYDLERAAYAREALALDSTPPAVTIAGPIVEVLAEPYYRVTFFDETATFALDESFVGVQKTGSIACGISVVPEAEAPGVFRVYLNACENVGNIAIYLKAGAAVDPYGNATAETSPSNSYRYVEPEDNRLFPTLGAASPYFYAGRETEITLDIATEETEPVTALGVTVNLPPGWTFNSLLPLEDWRNVGVSGGNRIEIVWIHVPQLPAQYTLKVYVPDNAAATGEITADLLYTRGGSRLVSSPQARLALSRLGVPQWHSLDYQPRDYTIDLSETLRAIQFYTLGGYHCQAGTEDGYAPGPGPRDCAPHTGDYRPIDWEIDFSELLRIVQICITGGYETCPDGEDGFCPVWGAT